MNDKDETQLEEIKNWLRTSYALGESKCNFWVAVAILLVAFIINMIIASNLP